MLQNLASDQCDKCGKELSCPSIQDKYSILTPLLLLFLICLYISNRALSKAFEHRNFVACYQRETNHITVAKVASLVTMGVSLQYWSKQSYT